MKYFTINELTATTTGLPNMPGATETANLTRLVNELLDPVREQWGKPVRVNSGYRSAAVNKAVGGAAASQHLKGEAADITAGTPDDNRRLFDLVQRSGLPFDQLIDEQNYRWLHISLKAAGNRRQVLHL
ncbi:MAG: peptidase M15 [Prevotellaceae bacterium]|jgi:hypothetical protein|nr:peptidase M15 [Prevotellaceae bacterium]